MRRWNKLRALSAREQRFSFAAFMLQPSIALALRIWGFGAVYAFLLRRPPTPQTLLSSHMQIELPGIEEPKNLARLANAAANHSPIGAACLTRSLTLWWLLRRRGIDGKLRIGVSNDTGGFEAHAWVEYEGTVINDSAASVQRFAAFDEALHRSGRARL